MKSMAFAAVVHEQLDARGPRIGEEVVVVGTGLTDGVDNDVEQTVGASAHVLRLGAQPQRVDTGHAASDDSHRVRQRAQQGRVRWPRAHQAHRRRAGALPFRLQ